MTLPNASKGAADALQEALMPERKINARNRHHCFGRTSLKVGYLTFRQSDLVIDLASDFDYRVDRMLMLYIYPDKLSVYWLCRDL